MGKDRDIRNSSRCLEQSGLTKVFGVLFLLSLLLGLAISLLEGNHFLFIVVLVCTVIALVAIREVFELWILTDQHLVAERFGREIFRASFQEIAEIRLDESRRRLWVTTDTGGSIKVAERTPGIWEFVSELMSEIRERRDFDVVGAIQITDSQSGEVLQ